MAYYKISDNTMTGIADQVRRLSGSTETLTPSEMISKLSSVNGEGRSFPPNVVYYNNMNGLEYSQITPRKLSYAGSTYTALANFEYGVKWGESSTALLKNGDASLDISFQRSDASIDAVQYVDNGFSSGNLDGFSIGGWFCKTANTSTYERAIYYYGPKSSGIYIPSSSNTALYIDVYGTAYSTGYNISLNTWYHFVISMERDSANSGYQTTRLYINGVLLKEYYGAYADDTTRMMIGCCGSYPWSGSVKNVFVSKGALSHEEIRQMMLMD